VDRADAANRAESGPRWRSLFDRVSHRGGDDGDRLDRDERANTGAEAGRTVRDVPEQAASDRGAFQPRTRRDDRTRVVDPAFAHGARVAARDLTESARAARAPAPEAEPAQPTRAIPRRRGTEPGVYGTPAGGSLFTESPPRSMPGSPIPPARGSARGQARGSVEVNGAYGGAGAYAPPAYVPAPPTQPTPPPISSSGPPASTGYPQATGQARGRSRLAGHVEWQAPPTSAGVDQIVAALRRDLGGPRVFAFANPKGGVHKTTATVLAAATIGGVRGRGVIAWDDNELRGTLGLRAGSARHARTIRHLVRDLPEIEASIGPELLERLDDYLRHASDGSYDVLAGEENPRFAQNLDPYTVRRVLELLRRTHDVICVDTGNNVESANWRTVLQMADQLVITTVPREDAAFTADWMLDLLYDNGLGDLVANAVTLLSCPTPNPSGLLQDLATHFATRTRAVAVVPYDPMLESGSSIEHTQLAPATRRAWLQAAGVFVEPFVR
jgi:MinD-like ATPase involved in chromosome partitioning or flagellar assembly